MQHFQLGAILNSPECEATSSINAAVVVDLMFRFANGARKRHNFAISVLSNQTLDTTTTRECRNTLNWQSHLQHIEGLAIASLNWALGIECSDMDLLIQITFKTEWMAIDISSFAHFWIPMWQWPINTIWSKIYSFRPSIQPESSTVTNHHLNWSRILFKFWLNIINLSIRKCRKKVCSCEAVVEVKRI